MKSVCGFCGVGCGLILNDNKIAPDKEHPINKGSLCTKGIKSLDCIDSNERLLTPKIRKDLNDVFLDTTFEVGIKTIAQHINKYDSSKSAFYISGQLLTEDYYVINKLAKGFIKTNHLDANSRMCMASSVEAHKIAFGIDYLSSKMKDIHFCDLVILVGSNCAESHVVFFNQIKKLKKNGLKVVVIDPRETTTAKDADLFLQINPGSDINFFNYLCKVILDQELEDKEFIAQYVDNYRCFANKIKRTPSVKALKKCGLTKEQFEKFFELIKTNKNIMTCWSMGINQSVQGVDKNLSIFNFHLITGKMLKQGNGVLSLTGQPNTMGGREVGGLSTALACHMGFDDESRSKVEKFWKTEGIKKEQGLSAVEIFYEALKGNIKTLIIVNTDPIYHLPNRTLMEEAIKKISLVVEINAYTDSETSQFAHIRLPAAPWGEKEGTQTNLDRTITLVKKYKNSPSGIKCDWEIFCLLAKELGFGEFFNYKKSEEIFDEFRSMCRLSKDEHLNIYETSYEELKISPFRWGEGLLKNGFFTDSKKANLVFVEDKKLSEKTNKEYPFILLTGRTRDQWHSGNKTAKVDALLKYKPLKFVEINSIDAKNLDIENGDSVILETKRGRVVTIAQVTDSIKIGVLFIPVSDRNMNYLTKDLLDSVSKEADFNMSATAIYKLKIKE